MFTTPDFGARSPRLTLQGSSGKSRKIRLFRSRAIRWCFREARGVVCAESAERSAVPSTPSCLQWHRRWRTAGLTATACGFSRARLLRASATAALRSSTRPRPAPSRWASRTAGGSPTTASSTTSSELRAELEARGERFETSVRHRGHAPHVRRARPGDARPPERHLRVRDLGRPGAAPLPRARPPRRQAALLHAARRHVRVRVGDQASAAAHRQADARPDGAGRLPDVPLGARPEDGVRRGLEASARPLRLLRATAGWPSSRTGTFATSPRSGRPRNGPSSSARPSTAPSSGRWSATSRSGAS